jgi:hypothetical protein
MEVLSCQLRLCYIIDPVFMRSWWVWRAGRLELRFRQVGNISGGWCDSWQMAVERLLQLGSFECQQMKVWQTHMGPRQ